MQIKQIICIHNVNTSSSERGVINRTWKQKYYSLDSDYAVNEHFIECDANVALFLALKPQSHIHGFGPGRATVHPDLASR